MPPVNTGLCESYSSAMVGARERTLLNEEVVDEELAADVDGDDRVGRPQIGGFGERFAP